MTAQWFDSAFLRQTQDIGGRVMATIPGCAVRSAALLSPANGTGADYLLTIKTSECGGLPQRKAPVIVNGERAGRIMRAVVREECLIFTVLDFVQE